MRRFRRHVAGGAIVVALFAACGDGRRPDVARSTPESSSPSVPPSRPGAGEPLPGERVDIFPYAGARLAVVGVATGDTLKVRAGPGVQFDVVVELRPLAADAVATGHNRSLGPAGFWAEIGVGGKTGWANVAFLLQPGDSQDITAAIYATPAARPSAGSMEALAGSVAKLRASEEPSSRVVVVDGPTLGDLAEVTVDVIGLGDDSQGGERLRIFADPMPGGGRFTLRTVEATALCSRGVTRERLCI